MAAAVIVPNPRLDVVVEHAQDGGRRRLTTYTGQIRCGTRTSVLGAAAWGNHTVFEHAWLLPDSLPYRADRVAGAEVHVSVAPLSMHDTFDVHHVAASLAPDPDQVHAWLRFDVSISTRTGGLATYRIDVLAAADAIDEPGRT